MHTEFWRRSFRKRAILKTRKEGGYIQINFREMGCETRNTNGIGPDSCSMLGGFCLNGNETLGPAAREFAMVCCVRCSKTLGEILNLQCQYDIQITIYAY
jgi:hypothetical protein